MVIGAADKRYLDGVAVGECQEGESSNVAA